MTVVEEEEWAVVRTGESYKGAEHAVKHIGCAHRDYYGGFSWVSVVCIVCDTPIPSRLLTLRALMNM